MTDHTVRTYQKELETKTPEEIMSWAIDHFGLENVVQASSLSAEDQVITDILLKINPAIKIFTLDTGRLPQETYDVLEETRKKYNKNIEIVFPDTKEVEDMVNHYGPNLFYESMDKRKLCCQIRKVNSLKKKLSGIKVWICGLRRDQASTRTNLKVIEWDSQFQNIKINPIVEWRNQQVWDYIHSHHVPYNKRHDQGYPSIGCACCTKAIQPGDDIRSGRWWWEEPQHKECGLHVNKRIRDEEK